MHPERTGSVESKNSEEEARREENTLLPRAVANIDPAQDSPTASNRYAVSDAVHPPYWAPQPAYPPFAPHPDQQRDQNMFQRRDLPPFTPLSVDGFYPNPQLIRTTQEPFPQPLAAPSRRLRPAIATNRSMKHTEAIGTTSHPAPKSRHTKNHPKNSVNSSNSPIKPSGIKKSKNLSSHRASSRSLDLSASLDRFETSARNLTASMASVQAILAELSAEVVYEAARFDAGRDAAVVGGEHSGEDEGENPNDLSS